MKIFLDTNVYIAEALLGKAAEKMVQATVASSWRLFTTRYVLDEVERVMSQELGFSRRVAFLTRRRILGRAITLQPSPSRHRVPNDPKDSPILQAALTAGADYLVTNDRHLLDLSPYEGLRIISMTAYYRLLVEHGLLS